MVSKLNNDRKAGEGAGQAISRIYGNIGFAGLWNGLPVRIFMIGTLTAFQWLIYDSFKVYLGVCRFFSFNPPVPPTTLLDSLTPIVDYFPLTEPLLSVAHNGGSLRCPCQSIYPLSPYSLSPWCCYSTQCQKTTLVLWDWFIASLLWLSRSCALFGSGPWPGFRWSSLIPHGVG